MYLPDLLRAHAARVIRQVFVGDDLPIAAQGHEGDPGLLGPDSVSWRVLADPSAVTGGVAALLMQACHPLALQGVVDHSAYRQDPFGRLKRTVSYVLVTSYGSRAEALAAADAVKRRHASVNGFTASGERYSASDERLMLWIHCALTRCILAAYESFGAAPLSRADADRFVAEQAVVVELLGVTAPTSVRELEEEIRSFRAELRHDENTVDAVRFMVNPPLPARMRLVYIPVLAGAVSVLDQDTVDLLGLSRPYPAKVIASGLLYRVWRLILPTNAVLQTAMERSRR